MKRLFFVVFVLVIACQSQSPPLHFNDIAISQTPSFDRNNAQTYPTDTLQQLRINAIRKLTGGRDPDDIPPIALLATGDKSDLEIAMLELEDYLKTQQLRISALEILLQDHLAHEHATD